MTDAEKAKAVKGAEAFFDGEGTDKSEDEGDQIQNTKEAEEEAEEDTEKDGTCVSEHEKHQHDADEVDNNACNGEDDKEKHEGSDAADKDEDHDSEEDVRAKEEVQKDELTVEESEDEEEGQEEQGTVDKELTTIAVGPLLEDTKSRKDVLPKPQATPKTRSSQRIIAQAGGKQVIAEEISKSVGRANPKRGASLLQGPESSDRPDASQKGRKHQRRDVDLALDPNCILETPEKQTGRKRLPEDSDSQIVDGSSSKQHKSENQQRQQQQKSTFQDAHSIRYKELSVLKRSTLQNMALQSGANVEEVDNALDGKESIHELVAIVLKHESVLSSQVSPAENEETARELRILELNKMTVGPLRKMALQKKISVETIDEAEDNDNFHLKENLIFWILEADAVTSKISILKKLATHKGATAEEVEQAMKLDNVSDALAALVLKHESVDNHCQDKKKPISRAEEIRNWNVSVLRKTALEKNIGEARMQEADESDDRKGSLVTFILQAENDDQSFESQEKEFRAMKTSDLRKMALKKNISAERMDQAEDNSDLKSSLVSFLLEADARVSKNHNSSESQVQLRTQQLLALQNSCLRKLAFSASATEAEIEKALDSQNIKVALVEVVLKHEQVVKGPSIQQQQALRAMTISELRKIGLLKKVSTESLDLAMDSASGPKDALIALVLDAEENDSINTISQREVSVDHFITMSQFLDSNVPVKEVNLKNVRILSFSKVITTVPKGAASKKQTTSSSTTVVLGDESTGQELLASVKQKGDSLQSYMEGLKGCRVKAVKGRATRMSGHKTLSMEDDASFILDTECADGSLLQFPYVQYDTIAVATENRLGTQASVLLTINAAETYYKNDGDPWSLVTVSDTEGQEAKLKCWGYEQDSVFLQAYCSFMIRITQCINCHRCLQGLNSNIVLTVLVS